ncbi:MAG: hypothetical protein P9X24_01750 [Candidatus Hatepunaea meridiana]|nr:hypothetical protein [Candidatus Hatepunaea meridiana]
MTGEERPVEFAKELTDKQRELLDKLADKIVRLRMSVPAILFLESVRPMNYVGSQVMVFFAPLVRGFFGLPEWDELRLVLEKRESIGYFLDLIEKREGDLMIEEEKRKAERKKQRKNKRNKSR